MQVLNGFWQFLNTDVRDIPWGELAEQGVEAVTATKDLGETFQEQAPNLKALKPYLQQVQPFLTTLDSPVTQLAVSGLPFVSIGIGLLRIYLDLSKTDPTFESSVAIAAQLAYLQSLEEVLSKVNDSVVVEKLNSISLKSLVERQLARLDTVQLSATEVKVVTSRFRESVLADHFSQALTERLLQADLDEAVAQRLVEQVAWGTHRFLHQAIAEAGDRVEPLAEFYRTGGPAIQERYDSIESYLQVHIAPLPQGQVFDESNPLITFQDIYVPLNVQPLTQEGKPQQDVEPVNIHDWVQQLLERPDEPRRVLFVEGDAGRGKSVFCRMLADWVRQGMAFSYIPILIRLRNLRHLANNLTETLENCPDLEQIKFVRGDADWLADRNSRFLIILDGFDELLLEGRATGGLKEFLQQVADFQERSHHQCLVTGRPLALQGVERLITQTKNLERVRLESMSDPLREQWFLKWQAIFQEEEVDKFRGFIQACPTEIGDTLAREPLLLYLLARLHRERQLHRDMFAGASSQASNPTQAKLRIYRESVNWVLEKQRQDENLRLAGLEDLEDLREVLREAALCVVQSGNETARLEMLKQRFQDTANPVAELLKQSQQTTGQSDDKALNNLLTTFYLKPGEGDKRGSVEFAHKSFGEYLFAERLLTAFKDWTAFNNRNRLAMDERQVNEQIYDLLGYDSFSVEIVEYLFELLQESDIDQVRLFERLHAFYLRWCNGEFLDQGPNENLPQKKMLQLKAQAVPTGLKQVDVFAGLNVLIVLFKLHAAAQPDSYPATPEDVPAPAISFYPCGDPKAETFDGDQLLKIISYADSLAPGTFTSSVGPHVVRANLASANLASANLANANFSGANLIRANLDSTNLYSANLFNANLYSAILISAILDRANLTSAILDRANLDRTDLYNAILDRANLTKATLYSTTLYGATLDNANLDRANLDSANLAKASLHRANLTNANLANTNLANANLTSADLTSADLTSADLTSAILLNTILHTVTNLSQQQLEGIAAPLICHVTLPPELTIPSNRDCEKLSAVLVERYPHSFDSLKEAEAYVLQFQREPDRDNR